MAITTVNLVTEAIGGGGIVTFDLPIAAATHIYKGQLLTQIAGNAVPLSTALGGVCIGVAQHEQNNTGAAGATRIVVESRRIYALTNGLTTDAFSEAAQIGVALAYALDDHTVADNSNGGALRACGFFMGMESDGKVRVLVDPVAAGLAETLVAGGISRFQVAGGTFVAGTATIATGITVTASTDAFVIASAVLTGSTNVGTFAHLKASNTVGVPGTGAVIINVLGDDGAVDGDAAGAFRVLLVN